MLYESEDLKRIDEMYQITEPESLAPFLANAPLSSVEKIPVKATAKQLISHVREQRLNTSGIDAFLAQYDLSSEEGITLMCLAEALLRIPDKATMDLFIADKLSSANWEQHLGQSKSLFVNASTWALMLTGKVLTPTAKKQQSLGKSLKNLLQKNSAPMIRKVILQAMKILGQQFVMETSIKSALKLATKAPHNDYVHSYDMLGEAAMNEADAVRYHKAYLNAIDAIGKAASTKDPRRNPGISVKLSALYSRYEVAEYENVCKILYPRLLQLALAAKQYHIGLTIDAEEAARLTLSLGLLEKLALEPDLVGWQGLGLAVQAYQKRAPRVLQWLVDLAARSGHRFMVRLVKGAYWDSEIKFAQENGYSNYPVYTRKMHTDVSYLALAQYMLQQRSAFYCQFATHNAYSLAYILTLAGDYKDYEFQRLHGMGEDLYAQVLADSRWHVPCRVYAPIGSFEYLLAYLVRRLLENGANSSFVNNILDVNKPVDSLIKDPFVISSEDKGAPNPHIPLPRALFGSQRKNALGINLANLNELHRLQTELASSYALPAVQATPLIFQHTQYQTEAVKVFNPANLQQIIGAYQPATEEQVNLAINNARQAFEQWQHEPVENNATRLEKMADLLESNMASLMALTIQEAGKSYNNAIAEIREAIDFCRYYAQEARELMHKSTILPGPTGEKNQLSLHPRGIIACIAPWNFPVAILLGEVSAALATGNVVLAKPAEQTTLLAYKVIKLLHEAGFPENVVQMLPGSGAIVGNSLVSHPDINGVIFTGSNVTARHINLALANKLGPITPLIAETGGQNCMLVDSSALHEQVVSDVVRSAFDSAGQRCSALRVLFLQEDIADEVITMLKGAMADLVVGDPMLLSTDIGPVIDAQAQQKLQKHIAALKPKAKGFYAVPANVQTSDGTFVLPTLIEIEDITLLTEEVFGPVLHVIRFKGKNLPAVLDSINSTGYGLTFGVHSRIEQTVALAKKHVRAGNLYVNRNTVGAIVGSQPFGGEGLSGTGPKAGGPHYLPRLCVERCCSTDTTAAGGNASLMGLDSL
jgi:RHH-type proline utilization regulon transcriptional repressor/proline dehydrogenase/delta 1-pyrroline-5-carboxylate dehydrogenase